MGDNNKKNGEGTYRDEVMYKEIKPEKNKSFYM